MTAKTLGQTLRVYVAPDCASCRTALSIVDAVRQARPEQRVDVVDLSTLPEEEPIPPGVIGTPTYLLDDRVISLGNPELPELLARLAGAASEVDD